MSSTYENTVFDFDLNFLNQPPTNNVEPDLQARADRLRKSIIFLKKRVKTVDDYVTNHYIQEKRILELENNEKQRKNECIQHHIEINNFIEKVTRLEQDILAAEAEERKKNETICELENKIVALQTVHTQLKLLVKEKNKTESTLGKDERKKSKAGVTNCAKKGWVEIEVETLRKDNAKILNLDKENEKLRKENARIPILEKEIESLRKNNTFISKSNKENDQYEIARIQKLEKEIETLCKENAKISKLEKEVEILNKKNAEISKLEKEIESLKEGNAKIPKLVKEIEILRKENAKIIKTGNENETLFKQSVIISNLEKDIENLRIKNSKIEIVNKALSKEIIEVPNKLENIDSRLTHLTSTTKGKGKSRQKCNKLTRKYKSLPDRNSEWCDNSEAGNDVFDDPLLSPTPNDTIIAQKSPIDDKDIAVRRESDNDNSNEVASVDTGRGSSLANSDTDKGIHSPEYFLNYSPSNRENIENKAKTKDTTMPKSPTLLGEIETKTITIVEHKKKQYVCEPKSVSHSKRHSKLLSPVNQTNAARVVSISVDTSDNVSSKKRTQGVQEKECLEMNNSLQCESHTDMELENIFSTMKLNYNAVSPIPRTPTKVHEVDSTSNSSNFTEKINRCRSLCDETVGFMRIVLELVLSHNRADRNMININDCDKFIACFESILKAEQTLTEHRIPNTNGNMEIPELPHDNNNLRSISNPESTSSENEREILQTKRGEYRLSQNVSLSKLHENQNQLLHDDNNSVTISNPSTPDEDTRILRNQQVEKRLLQCLPMSMDVNQKQLLKNSVSEELTIDNKISEVTDSFGCSRDIVEINKPLIQNSVGIRVKSKKNTKLEKLKKKLKPKYKIKMETTLPRNLRIKPKQLFSIINKVTVNDTSASLNHKDAYEKAVKFMAEMNSQQSATAKSPPKALMSPRRSGGLEIDINSNGDSQVLQNCSITTRSKRKCSELFDTCTVVLTKDPLSYSPCKAKNAMTHKAEKGNNSTNHRAKEDKNSITQTAKEDNNFTTQRLNKDDNFTTHTGKEDNNSTTYTTKEDNTSTTHRATEDNNSATHRAKENKNFMTQKAYGDKNSTTYTAKEDNNSTTHKVNENYNSATHTAKEDNSMSHKEEEDKKCTALNTKEENEPSDELPLKKRRRRSSDEPLVQYKRVLRSATIHSKLSTEDNIELSKSKGESNRKSIMGPSANESDTQFNKENTLQYLQLDHHDNDVVSYGDLDIFSEDIKVKKKMSDPVREVNTDVPVCHPKESILCYMIEKYGVETMRPYEKKIPDNTVKKICEQIEQNITTITHTNDSKNAINNFIGDLRKLNYKHLIAGLLKFLAKPERKLELIEIIKARTIRKVPSMTKAEGILLYAIQQLKTHWPSVDIVEAVMCSIEFSLFKLNRTPEFDVIESTSHFYALLCKHFKTKSRLRLFILDAMYCIQFKSVSLIKQCLEVWEQLLPLQHMGTAKSPLMICLVYLLNFYKCDDKFKRVAEIRQILRKQYYYEISDWNESKILEMFKNSIKDLREISIEKKMLRLALIILAKRQGPQWCQNHLIKNLLQPMIEKENVSNNVKEFCVSMIGPLMKPYPVDMKVHCEIAINQLVHILNNNPSLKMEEAAIMSMMYINRHDQRSINKMLLSRKMKTMSLALENSIRNYVKAKPLKIWKKHLTTIARQN